MRLRSNKKSQSSLQRVFSDPLDMIPQIIFRIKMKVGYLILFKPKRWNKATNKIISNTKQKLETCQLTTAAMATEELKTCSMTTISKSRWK